jgi:hypothetical protein
MYKTLDVAYSDIDFSGKGYITEEDFFKTILIYKIKYSNEELKEYFKRDNAFKGRVKSGKVGMGFEVFKKHFFPSEAMRFENPMKRMVKATENPVIVRGNETKEEINIILTKKLKNLESILKKKFEKNWISVKKAFLDLDADYDGYIKPEDIARYFSNESNRVDFSELKQLMIHKGHKNGLLDYTDFSKWVGSAIEPSAGFYFRHDSIRNPQYEMNQARCSNKNGHNTKIVREKMTETNFLK